MSPTVKLLLPVALLALAGCATADRAPINPVGHFQYGALGHDPFWILAIGDDRIVLTLGGEGGRADGGLASFEYPRALPSETDGIRRWQSGEGSGSIRVEARPETCTQAGRTYPDRVKVTLKSRVLEGCGGRETGGRG